MFDFGNANEGQRLAISTADGPVLITAGPGTGKTFTLVQRAIYLIQECGVAPEQIMMATFTEKAAKELVTRITNELASRDIVVNVNEMYIGTFHSLCLRIIKEHLEFTRLKRNYRTLDAFDQNYTVFQNISRFRAIKDIDTLLPKGSWKMAQEICVYVNNLMEELVDPDALKTDGNPDIRILGNVLEAYKDILVENNLVDFASIQTEAYRLMKDNPEILKELQNRLQYIMIDEYQDTNYIQEQIVFLLAGDRQNICVVGDDDQGLYRFRGATIRNILEFPDKFPEGMCKIIPLVINYRSNSDIVDFYNKWMATTDGATFKFDWDKYRYIIEGKIDLVKGENGTVEIVDFKSEKKPDLVKQADRLEQYRRQLHLYAHLIEERTGQKVSKMHLYYTGEENGVPTITYPYTKTAIDGTVAAFEDTVHKIMRKEYKHCASDIKVCKNCDFRFYCQNQ